MSETTAELIARLDALAKASTPGEWSVDQADARNAEDAGALLVNEVGYSLADTHNRDYHLSLVMPPDCAESGQWTDEAGAKDLEECAALHNAYPRLRELALRAEALESALEVARNWMFCDGDASSSRQEKYHLDLRTVTATLKQAREGNKKC